MPKLLIFTDLHIVEPGSEIIGLSPSERFAEGLAHALKHHPDSERIFLTGDLTHHGRPAQYAELKRLLSDVPLPISYLLGNHDNRANFCVAFPEVPLDAGGFVQSVVDFADQRVICLDTLDPETEPHHGGRLCAERMSWLETALEGPGAKLVLQHHHPAPVGFDGMDAIALANGAEELALLANANVRHMIFGHIHRTISGSFGPVSFSTFKSTCHQMPMRLGDASSALSVDEPGAYGIVLLNGADILVHCEDFALAGQPLKTDQTSES